jgi:hypothetical protein
VVSSGWFNPYGLAVTSAGAVWAADNAPIGQPDHIARADLSPRPAQATNIGHVAPTGLAAAGNDLYLCGYVTRQLMPYRIERDGHAHQSGTPLAHDCSIGVIRLADGRLAYANEHEIRVLTPRTPHPSR